MKSLLFMITFLFTVVVSNAQKNVYLSITHKLAENAFAFEQTAQNNLNQEFKITRIDYYISSIKIIHDGGMETSVPDKYILVKGRASILENLGSCDVTSVEGVTFSIGVEAPINNEDPSLQPFGSPLSYQNPSMHWGWAPGYRFIALEGKSGNGLNETFQLHGLWNDNYFQQTKMPAGVPNGTNDIYINLDADITQALKDINLSGGQIAHGTNNADLTALKNFRDYVFSPSPTTTSNNDLEGDSNIIIYPNPTAQKIFVGFSHPSVIIDEFKIVDFYGKIVMENKLNNNEIDVSQLAKGSYILQFHTQKNDVLIKKIIIN